MCNVLYLHQGPLARRHEEQITNSDSGNGSNDGDVELVNSPRRQGINLHVIDIAAYNPHSVRCTVYGVPLATVPIYTLHSKSIVIYIFYLIHF